VSEYLELSFDVFDETEQRASVRPTLTVAELILEILNEFEDLDGRRPDLYGLYPEGSQRPLERGKTLTEQGVQPGDRLAFSWARDPLRQLRRPLTQGAQFALQDAASQVLFGLEWQPAIIGRPDADPAHNELLAVNVKWLSGSRRVSRRHARITEQGGVYYLEGLAENNPTLLNGHQLSPGRKYQLRKGDTIGLGISNIQLVFVQQS
jgi:pSer/pThr/pTyr-binding forkhead associated (FHA) protein